MEAVLTCMVDEHLGPGDTTVRLIQTVKEIIGCDGAIALRSPSLALEYALRALELPKGSGIMLSALAPAWQILTVEKLGYEAVVLDVKEDDGLISVAAVEEGIKKGGRLLILTESMGILPDIHAFLAFGLPVIEDISQSALSYYPVEKGEDSSSSENGTSSEPSSETTDSTVEEFGRRAGMYGVYTIFGMEEKDIITAGGGAVLFAPGRREWTVLKKYADEAPFTDLMPDMNAALAWVELKEFNRNETVRRELFTAYSRAIMSGSHKTFVRAVDSGSTIYSFPVVLNSGFKDVKAYAHKKGIEVRQAFENSVIALRQSELAGSCICANSLLLRCALFPLYPRLGQKDAGKIVKVLMTLP